MASEPSVAPPQPSRMTALLRWLGADPRPVTVLERTVAILGSLVAMLIVFAVSRSMPGGSHVLIVASTGASAVIIFTVPHGRLSQPWPVLVGHLLCGLIGVTCAKWLGTGPMSAAITVSLCVLVMSVGRCVHPPAGATALTAVLGGSLITDLGYSFVLAPVMVNMLTLIGAAVLINLPFRWRRYPATLNWQRRKALPPSVDRSDLTYALSKIDTFMDI
ncbi:MAG: HPP family protein, partial [Pseudomonadota bacterium]